MIAQSSVVVSKTGKKQPLSVALMKISSSIRSAMHRWRRFSPVMKRLDLEAAYFKSVMAPYLIGSGFIELPSTRHGYYRFTSTHQAVVETAFCSTNFMPSGRNPARNVEFVRSHHSFATQVAITGANPSLVANLNIATKQSLVVDAMAELGLDQQQANVMNRGQLIEAITDQRIANGTYLGIKYLHELAVDNTRPFTIYVHPVKNGMCAVKMRFRVRKTEVVFTNGATPPIHTNHIYA